MGLEIQVDSLDDMCALMCDNTIPRKRGKNMNQLERYAINQLRDFFSKGLDKGLSYGGKHREDKRFVPIDKDTLYLVMHVIESYITDFEEADAEGEDE